MFPVEVAYLKEPVVDYVQAAVDTVFNIHLKVSWAPMVAMGDMAGSSLEGSSLPPRALATVLFEELVRR
jgi:HrpA-like RNA helicase